MLDDFETAEVETGETTIFVRRFGRGPPVLLLHGFPQRRDRAPQAPCIDDFWPPAVQAEEWSPQCLE
jgi:pimeloyl-ACP methyl ester carboxylesterase